MGLDSSPPRPSLHGVCIVANVETTVRCSSISDVVSRCHPPRNNDSNIMTRVISCNILSHFIIHPLGFAIHVSVHHPMRLITEIGLLPESPLLTAIVILKPSKYISLYIYGRQPSSRQKRASCTTVHDSKAILTLLTIAFHRPKAR